MEDSDGDGSGYNFNEIKTGIGDGDRFHVEQHYLMTIEDDLVIGIWSSGLISLRLNLTLAAPDVVVQ